MNTITIKYNQKSVVVEASGKKSLFSIMVSSLVGVFAQDFQCTPQCRHCIIQISSGTVSVPTDKEKSFLTPNQLLDGYRLACETFPLGNVSFKYPVSI